MLLLSPSIAVQFVTMAVDHVGNLLAISNLHSRVSSLRTTIDGFGLRREKLECHRLSWHSGINQECSLLSLRRQKYQGNTIEGEINCFLPDSSKKRYPSEALNVGELFNN